MKQPTFKRGVSRGKIERLKFLPQVFMCDSSFVSLGLIFVDIFGNRMCALFCMKYMLWMRSSLTIKKIKKKKGRMCDWDTSGLSIFSHLISSFMLLVRWIIIHGAFLSQVMSFCYIVLIFKCTRLSGLLIYKCNLYLYLLTEIV